MMIPTVRVHHPLDHDVCMIINADQVTDLHQIWTDPIPSEGEALKVAKGARGLWFVKRGAEAVTTGFRTEAEAEAAKVDLS